MSDFIGRLDGPPLEAYSRVTYREPFALLHGLAAELLCRLETEFEIDHAARYGLYRELEGRCRLARPTVQLRRWYRSHRD
jgi:hypothetical protein